MNQAQLLLSSKLPAPALTQTSALYAAEHGPKGQIGQQKHIDVHSCHIDTHQRNTSGISYVPGYSVSFAEEGANAYYCLVKSSRIRGQDQLT